MELSFIIIDESELDCFIARKVIENADKNLGFEIFLSAEKALEAIRKNSMAEDTESKKIILLDLQMPLMDGFQFVEAFEKLPVEIQKKYTIMVLSCTLNRSDITRILAYNTVDSRLEKPFTKEKLASLMAHV
jgi:CheY-like chemotaxis protein